MAQLNPKQFIRSLLIDDIGKLIKDHPYISFILMGIGIEYLGKCINTEKKDWNFSKPGSRKTFENAIKSIPSLKKYETYLKSHDMYSSFRCGLAHALTPKNQITLSSKQEMAHITEHDGKINFKAEEFYCDFKQACEFVINQSFPIGDKMNENFLIVPGSEFNSGTDIESGITSSFKE
jgi:hypothetical protein